MPEKSLTLAYAAGASLAAITLVYVFAPTYFLDSEPTAASSGGLFSSRRKGAVGLSNPANDCFINSVLQALTGLGDLRLYLIRETHRRELDDGSIYPRGAQHGGGGGGGGEAQADDAAGWKREGLQSGIVTKGLKDILDALNERPLHKKTISAASFIRTLETAFRQRISRQQQDAQEFLQVVAERLCDEYRAGRKARRRAKRKAAATGTRLRDDSPASLQRGGDVGVSEDSNASEPEAETGVRNSARNVNDDEKAVRGNGEEETDYGNKQDGEDGKDEDDEEDEEHGFPFEGRSESQIECLTCGFKPRPTETTFCMLVLNVPQVPSTTLSACFDSMFRTEYIDGFRCEKCRLVHAITMLETGLRTCQSAVAREETRQAMAKLQDAIDTDPEKPPVDVALPDMQLAPKRRIARHIRLTGFPSILAIHLSRSIYDPGAALKNAAKVAFPEQLPLGGLLQQRRYKLLGLVTHKGSHYSGHYESFRRQNVYPPFSNPNTFHASGPYSKTPGGRPVPTETSRVRSTNGSPASVPAPETPDPPSSRADSPAPSTDSRTHTISGVVSGPASTFRSGSLPARERERERDLDSGSLRSVAASARSTLSRMRRAPTSLRGSDTTGPRARSKQSKHQDKWWRISDDKIKEASTRDVLNMQREVYLLFYELDRSQG